MGKRTNKKMINVLTASLASAVLLGTSTTNSLAYEDSATETSATALTAQQQENSQKVQTYTVTLVTGDVVHVEKQTDGTLVCTLKPREDGSEESFITKSIDEGFYVIPNKATPFLAAGQLDEELFNITKLIEYGYDDSHQSSIPMIVTEESGKISPSVSEAADEAVSTGATEKVELHSVNAVAVKTDKKHAKKFWEAVDGDGVVKQAQPELTDGIKKIWLDKPVHVLADPNPLEKSTVQIGADKAWAGGFDGKGVKVAVLDTGIDQHHPDVQGIFTDTKSFIAGETVDDGHGHGTHVAATIAGTGAAFEGGKRKGVAPGAKLIIGKVLSNEGSGTDSGIIAGMEWAAVQEKADIVSMSLGGGATDGTDPLAQAVNNLSTTTNTLFVIAAGNAGSKKNTIGSPGSAEKALTVGAVDSGEFLASFSSRGPIPNNYRVKPEITAPGVNIIAARAAGTSLGTVVDANYTSLNGTSMATPHVAGAAAILKQKHPKWTGDQIKQVLTSTAVVSKPQFGVYDQGAGRVSIPDALDATVYSSPAVVSMGAGMVADQPIEKIFTYVNPTDSEVTLNLTTSLTAPGFVPEADKAKIFTLDKSVVTVPAQGTSPVKVTFNPLYGNIADDRLVVTATPSAGGNKIKTTIGATKTEPLVNVTINRIDRNGNPARPSSITALNLDTGTVGTLSVSSGTDTIRLQPGHWSLMDFIPTWDGANVQSYTLAGEPNAELVFKQDKTITMDARLGEEVKVATPKESESAQIKLGYKQKTFSGIGGAGLIFNTSSRSLHMYEVPTGPVKDFEFIFQQRKFAPELRASYDGQGGSISLIPVKFVPKLDGVKTLKAVYVGKGSTEDLGNINVSGKLAVAIRDVTKKPGQQINAIAAAGAEAVVLVNDQPGLYKTEALRADNVAIPAWTLRQDDGAVLINRIANGPTNINFKGTPNSPYAYNYATVVPGGIPADFSDEITEENSEIVNTHYRSTKNWLQVGETNSAFRPGESIAQWVEFFEHAPVDREEWYSTGSKSPVKEMSWLHTVFPDAGKGYVSALTRNMKSAERYAPSTKREETWMGAGLALVGPEKSSTGKAKAYRQGDNFNLYFNEQGDSEPTHYGWFDWQNIDDVVKMRVYQDGKLLAERPQFNNTKVPVSANPANYQITIDTTRPDWIPVSTKTSTSWTFNSERTADGDWKDLGLLWPKYGFDLDMENKAMRGITDHFDLSFILQSLETPNMKGVEAAVSTDDGNTWSNTKVEKRENGHYTVTVKNPNSGFVSIRIKATDVNGNQVEQTLIRAYAVR